MSDEFVFTNNAESALASPMGGGDGTFTVTAGGGALFPNITVGGGQKFVVLLQAGATSEYMVCTSRSGDIFTVTRTGSNAFATGSTVKLVITKEILDAVLQKGVFRSVTTNPNGVLNAIFPGEEVYQSVTKHFWKHTTGTEWKQTTV